MSKLMGKILCKELLDMNFKAFKALDSCNLRCRYLKTSDSFEFVGVAFSKVLEEEELLEATNGEMSLSDIGEEKVVTYKISCNDLMHMIRADKNDDIVCEWSIGYSSRNLIEDKNVLMQKEMKEIPSVSNVVYKDISVWQYLFCVSESTMKDIIVQWKRNRWNRNSTSWVELNKRQLDKYGRKKGAVGIATKRKEDVEWTEEMIEHNKKVAVIRGVCEWYIEACRQECKMKQKIFYKEKCLKEWEECRKILMKEKGIL